MSTLVGTMPAFQYSSRLSSFFFFIFASKIDLKRVILLEQTVMHLALNQGTFACSLGKFLSCQYDDVTYAIVVRSL